MAGRKRSLWSLIIPALAHKGVQEIVNLTRHRDLTDLVPTEFYLSQNYPNPFSEKTTIKLCVAYKTRVRLDVFDFEGVLVKTLLDEEKEPGTYEIEFSAPTMADRSAFGDGASNLSEGVYFYELQAGDYSSTKRMILRR